MFLIPSVRCVIQLLSKLRLQKFAHIRLVDGSLSLYIQLLFLYPRYDQKLFVNMETRFDTATVGFCPPRVPIVPFQTRNMSLCTCYRLRSRPAPINKRGRRSWWHMEVVEGGSLPESHDTAPEVQFFASDTSETPDTAPSLAPDSSSTVELPLFPLQLVVNPGSNVPLHIFEMRYRLMFNRLQEENSQFGIVLYESKSNSLALFGCAAEVTRFDPLPDGRIMTNNVGKQRFKIIRIIEEKPYIRAKVELLHDAKPTENICSALEDVWQALLDVLRLSNKLYGKNLDLSPDIRRLAPSKESETMKPEADEQVPDGWPSPKKSEEFSFAVCQILEMPLKEQQIMLQLTDTGARLRRQHTLLNTARQYLAAQVTIKEAGLKDS